MDIFMPDFYSRFECSADKCPDTCCAGWDIVVDSKTHKKYIDNENILGMPADNWLQKKNGIIQVIRDHERCPMLNEQGLCNVVLKLGSEYLCHTCEVYPRTKKEYGFVSEVNMNLSCPEVVRLLMEPDYIVSFKLTDNMSVTTSDRKPDHVNEYLYQSKVRSILIDLISNYPDLLLQTKVYAIYNILDRAIIHYNNGNRDIESLAPAITSFINYNSLKSIDKSLNGIIGVQNQYQLVLQFKDLMKLINAQNTVRQELLNQTTKYLDNLSLQEYAKKFAEFSDTLKEYHNALINFWICQIFDECIQIPTYNDAKDQLAFIAAKLFFTNTVAFAEFSQNNSLTKEKYIDIVSKTYRITDHNKSFKKHIINLLEKNNLVSAAGMLLLLLI